MTSNPRFSLDADLDLDEISDYLQQIPPAPAAELSRAVDECLTSIAQHPLLGNQDSELTRLIGDEVRTRLVKPYRIFYKPAKDPVEIIAILHMARDVRQILRQRLS